MVFVDKKKSILSQVPDVIIVSVTTGSVVDIGRVPLSMAAKHLHSHEEWALDFHQIRGASAPPYPCGENDLVVCFTPVVELTALARVGWPIPANVLDIRQEVRSYKTAGVTTLADACKAVGIYEPFRQFSRPPILNHDVPPPGFDTHLEIARARGALLHLQAIIEKIQRRLNNQLRSREAIERGRDALRDVHGLLMLHKMNREGCHRLAASQ